MTQGVVIRPFEPRDQTAARQLIVEGLGDHFGFIDEEINRDLVDVASSYGDEVFLVAEQGGRLVGTGALVREAQGVGRIMRMSVQRKLRRQGIGTAMIERLLDQARALGYRRVILGTGHWEDSVGLYQNYGFVEKGRDATHYYFAMELEP